MTLRHIGIFIKVCEFGSITKAANDFHIAQPSVSLVISELEKYYNVKLFDRISRKLYLTSSGKKMYEYGKHVLSLFSKMETEMLLENDSLNLKIAATITIGTCFLPQYIKKFMEIKPEANIFVTIKNCSTIEQLILNNDIDIALIEGLTCSDSIINIPYMEDELIMVCGKDNPVSKKGTISLEEIGNFNFILREKGSSARELFDAKMTSADIKYNLVWECNSNEPIINAVSSGLGISIIPKCMVTEKLDNGILHQIKIENMDFKRQLKIAYHKDKYFTSGANIFLELIKNIHKNL